MDLKRPTIKLNILVLHQTNENIVVFSVLKSRVVLSETLLNCPIVSADLKITLEHRWLYAWMTNFKPYFVCCAGSLG